MRAIVFKHRDTGRRYTIACIQQAIWFLARDDRDDWQPWHARKRRWRQ